MIKKIQKIKNLGLFLDFSWNKDFNELNRFNLIYGPNASGKTTLSKLFLAFEKGELENYPNLEYEIKTESGNYKQGQKYIQKIRVFNQDYIANNIDRSNSTATPIFIIGEENKKIADQIIVDETTLISKQEKLKQNKEDLIKKENERSKIFKDIAGIISISTGGLLSRTYRKPDAERKFNTLTGKKLLSDKDIGLFELTLRQQEKPFVNEVSLLKINGHDGDIELKDLVDKTIENSNLLMKKTVESVVIERLIQNKDISLWVEEGIKIHKEHQSLTCEYCNQPIQKDRLIELSKHFSLEDKKIKEQIDAQLDIFRNIYKVVDETLPVDKAYLYDELQPEYEIMYNNFKTAKINLLNSITSVGNLLKDKKLKTTDSMDNLGRIDTKIFINCIKSINNILRKHNQKTNNFNSQKDNARDNLEVHYLSKIYDDLEIIKFDLDKYQKEQELLIKGDPAGEDLGIEGLKAKIQIDKAKITSSQKACDEINDNLKSFLGRDDIVFEVCDGGYLIKRNGIIAENLSEGEKTAIAFTHFIIHLNDRDFDIKSGIVVVDDPISSLDSNLVFRVCSFIEKTIRKANQIFILTHNYEFLNHVKNWLTHDDGTKNCCRFLMINNYFDKNSLLRVAEISELDSLLFNYESEYHFLFSKLYHFKEECVSDTQGRIAAVYHYPNMSRKLLECFLSFRVPTSSTVYVKLMSLTEFNKEIKPTDLSEIYGFVNSNSHLDTKTGLIQFDPTLTTCGDKCIELILKIIKQADEKHYKYMEKAINKKISN